MRASLFWGIIARWVDRVPIGQRNMWYISRVASLDTHCHWGTAMSEQA